MGATAGRMKEVVVLRIGHRLVRDDRVTTHAALVSRAFGASALFMTDVDDSIKKTVSQVTDRWGNPEFEVSLTDDWKKVIRDWKASGGKVAHLTMYGVNIDDAIEEVKREERVLAIIGAEKVPIEVYDMADYNIAVGNQPHSEIAALAIFLDRIFGGAQLKKDFGGGRIKIIPSKKGKKVQEMGGKAELG